MQHTIQISVKTASQRRQCGNSELPASFYVGAGPQDPDATHNTNLREDC